MYLWKEAINAVKPRSWADIIFRPSHNDEGLGPAIHPEEYGATDDLRLAASYGDDVEEHTHATLRDALRKEANDLVRALGLQNSDQVRQGPPGSGSPLSLRTNPPCQPPQRNKLRLQRA